MSDQALTARDRLVISKYLIEAAGKERQLETALQGQITLARSPVLRRSLIEHLAVTRRQIDAIDSRVGALGADHPDAIPGIGAAEAVVELAVGVANKGLALAKVPLQALRGTSPADNELRAVRDCYWNEAEEIAHYRVIETVAAQIGDAETAELAERHRKEEEAMQHHLEGLLPGVVRSVVDTEAPDASTPGAAKAAAPTKPAAKRTTAARKPAARTKAAAAK